MSIQSDINKVVGSIAGGLTALKVASNKKAEMPKMKGEGTEDAYTSVGNRILGEALATNPKLKDEKYAMKAIDTLDRRMALKKRLDAGSAEYKKTIKEKSALKRFEEADKLRQEQFDADTAKAISRIGMPGRPKGGK